ncbi:MAG TPA: glycosyl hydrolase family 28-related protein [Thermoleophilaceae bacterium]|nr:glycosyl hydrolase family 28-related protein [Thermoleophilaceae bacterium]
MSAPRTSGHTGDDQATHTRRSVLAGGVAGALGATVLAPVGADAQETRDDRYVWRTNVPLNVADFPREGNPLETHDGPRIQRAINQAQGTGGGGVVYFPPGDYEVNSALVIAPGVPLRLEGAGQVLGPLSASARPVRLRRGSGSDPIIRVGSDSSNAFVSSHSLEICNIMFRGTGSGGLLADFTACNPLNLHNVTFASGDGIRLRQVFNSNASSLYFHGCGNASVPTVLFDALPMDQGGCATVHWTNVEWENNQGIDLMLDGYHSDPPAATIHAPTVDVRITNWKSEGGSGGPHVKLGYAQSVVLDNGSISFHGRGTSAAIEVEHFYGGTNAANKIPCLEIGYSGGDTPDYAIKVKNGKLDIGQLNVTAATAGPTKAAISVDSGANADALKVAQVRTNMGKVLEDARSRAIYKDGIEVVPKVLAYHSQGQTVASGYHAVQFDSDGPDAGTATEQHVGSGQDNTKLTCKVAGFYAIEGHVELAASSAGTLRAAAILRTVPGSPPTVTTIGGWAKSTPLNGTTTVNLAVSATHQLGVGDYVELWVYHDVGAGLTVSHLAGSFSPHLSMVYLSP